MILLNIVVVFFNKYKSMEVIIKNGITFRHRDYSFPLYTINKIDHVNNKGLISWNNEGKLNSVIHPLDNIVDNFKNGSWILYKINKKLYKRILL